MQQAKCLVLVLVAVMPVTEAAKVTPVQKVLQLLQGMVEEGKKGEEGGAGRVREGEKLVCRHHQRA